MANKTWLWLEKRLLWLIKISTFLSRFLGFCSGLLKAKWWILKTYFKSPTSPMRFGHFKCVKYANVHPLSEALVYSIETEIDLNATCRYTGTT
jgi:hypothetical protein